MRSLNRKPRISRPCTFLLVKRDVIERGTSSLRGIAENDLVPVLLEMGEMLKVHLWKYQTCEEESPVLL